MSDQDALVVFTPSGRRVRVPVGTPLLQVARSLGVDIDSVCGGRAIRWIFTPRAAARTRRSMITWSW